MKLAEFEQHFDALWMEKYALYDRSTDHWTRARVDTEVRQQCRDMLMEYARECQKVGISRQGKNKAQRLFEELGIDPASLEFHTANRTAMPYMAQHIAATSKGRIMYMERKTGKNYGEAIIGRVTASKSGRTLYYGGMSFRHIRGGASNYCCVETGEHYWISGCKQDGSDRLFGERVPILIDDDVRLEYWCRIRNLPECKDKWAV